MDSVLGRIAATVLTLLVLAAVGLGIYKAFSGNKVAQTVTDLSMLVNSARAQYSQGNGGYTAFAVTNGNAGALINSNGTSAIIPSDMIRGGQVVDAWGNTVSIVSLNNGSQFRVDLGGNGVTASQCAQLLTEINGYVWIGVTNGATVFTPAAPPNATTAAGACTGATANAIEVNFE